MTISWPSAFKFAGGVVWVLAGFHVVPFGWEPVLFDAGLIAIGFSLPLVVKIG